jgi:hypothetical protein
MTDERIQGPDRDSQSDLVTDDGRICNYRELRVWQESMNLAEQVYLETRSFPTSERFGLRRQIRDAASSIPSNLAEGHRRRGSQAFLAYVGI